MSIDKQTAISVFVFVHSNDKQINNHTIRISSVCSPLSISNCALILYPSYRARQCVGSPKIAATALSIYVYVLQFERILVIT